MPIINVRDFFNGGAGDIDGRIPDQVARSSTWQRLPNGIISGRIGGPPIQETNGSVGLDSGGTNNGNYSVYTVGKPRSPNYRIKATLQGGVPSGGLAFAGIVARATSLDEYYYLERKAEGFSGTSSLWLLYKFWVSEVEGVMTPQSTIIWNEFGPIGNFSVVAELIVRGNTLTVIADGVQKAQVIDPDPSFLTAAGKAGLSMRIGNHADTFTRAYEFEVIDLVSPINMIA